MSGPDSSVRVLYDHQVFTWQNFGGISRYYADLMTLPAAASGIDARLSLRFSDNAYINDSARFRDDVQRKAGYRRPFYARPFKRLRALHNVAAANRAHTEALLRAGDFDIFHPTYYDPYFLEHLREKPFVITVYDMIHELFPEFYFDEPVSKQKQQVFQRADRILSISHSTKKDLMQIYGLPSEKIDVVHLGSTLRPGNEPVLPVNVPGRFLLFVGNRFGYKNGYFMLRALRNLLLSTPDLHVVCAGGGPFGIRERQFLTDLGIEGRVHHHDASTPALVALYQQAVAFIFPSLYEGFGLPVLEAFNCGCPVLASDTPALVEVAEDAALYFDSKSVSSLERSVRRILAEQDLRTALREKGAHRGKEFSTEKCARETAAVYADVINRSSRR